MSQYEIEIKTLLGDKGSADALKAAIIADGADENQVKRTKQLNHYFVCKNIKEFGIAFSSHIPEDKREKFLEITDKATGASVRTRQADEKVIFVIKVSLGDDTSSNGVSRQEFESEMDMTLDILDQLLLEAGLEYQAKWSREREEYKLGKVTVCIDKNAGYGYLAEFEEVVGDQGSIEETKKSLYSLMNKYGVKELPQDRIERMFSYYNANWRDYYGTEKVFNIQ